MNVNNAYSTANIFHLREDSWYRLVSRKAIYSIYVEMKEKKNWRFLCLQKLYKLEREKTIAHKLFVLEIVL